MRALSQNHFFSPLAAARRGRSTPPRPRGPDGHPLRPIACPHPFGGVLLIYEDVTDRLTLERSYNTLIEVQRETLDNLYEGVAVYGADGRLKLSNPAFARIWGLPAELLAGEPHVRTLVEY